MTLLLFWGTKPGYVPTTNSAERKRGESFLQPKTTAVEPFKIGTAQVTPTGDGDEDGLKVGVGFTSVTDYSASDNDPSSPGLA